MFKKNWPGLDYRILVGLRGLNWWGSDCFYIYIYFRSCKDFFKRYLTYRQNILIFLLLFRLYFYISLRMWTIFIYWHYFWQFLTLRFFYFKDDDKRGIFLHQKASIYFSNKDSSLTNEGVKDATEMGMKKIHWTPSFLRHKQEVSLDG